MSWRDLASEVAAEFGALASEVAYETQVAVELVLRRGNADRSRRWRESDKGVRWNRQRRERRQQARRAADVHCLHCGAVVEQGRLGHLRQYCDADCRAKGPRSSATRYMQMELFR